MDAGYPCWDALRDGWAEEFPSDLFTSDFPDVAVANVDEDTFEELPSGEIYLTPSVGLLFTQFPYTYDLGGRLKGGDLAFRFAHSAKGAALYGNTELPRVLAAMMLA